MSVTAAAPPPTATVAGAAGAFSRTWVLTRVALRRDRVRTPAWAIGVGVLFVFTASAWDQLYPTAAERVALAAALGASPALTALLGPLFDPISTGGLTAWRLGSISTLVLALVNVFLVVRHSRAEEQDGRTELALSGVVGRCAPLAAALLAAAALDVLVVVVLVGLLGATLGLVGTLTMALAVAGSAFVFAAVAGLAAQAARTGRGANGIGSLVAAVTFASAAAANSASADPGGVLLWISPFGWVQQSRAFADNRWAVVGLSLVVALVLAALALAIVARRDLGAGLVRPREGRPGAPGWLTSPLAMAWRLDRGSLAVWLAGAAAYGVLVGWLVQSAVDLIADSPQLGQLIAQLGGTDQIADSYVVLMALFFALVSSAFGVSTMLRVHADEEAGRAELLLSTSTSRMQWIGARVVTAGLGSLLILAVGGTMLGAVYGSASSDVVGQALRYGAAAVLAVPAVWVVVAAACAVVGVVPRYAWGAWLVLVWCGVIAVFGEVMNLPDALQRTSPFWYSSAWPVESFAPVPLLGLLIAAALLVAGGLLGLRRRDIPA